MSLLEQQGLSLGARHPACSIQTHKHSHKAQEVTAKVESYQDIAGGFFGYLSTETSELIVCQVAV